MAIGALKRTSGTVLQVHHPFQSKPFLTAAEVTATTGLAPGTVNTALETLTRMGIVREVTGRLRNRLFCYERYLSVLSEGTEPL